MEDMNFRAAREKGSAQTPTAGLGPVDNENGCFVITRIHESYFRGTDRSEAVVKTGGALPVASC
jgi:hypothetical protein